MCLGKKLLPMLAILLCLIGMLGENIVGKAESEGNQFSIEGELALDGTIKLARDTTVTIKVTNHGADFNGLTQVTSFVDGRHVLYEKSLGIAAGETKEITIEFPVRGATNKLYIQVADEAGKVLKSKEIKIKKVLETTEYLCGVLAERQELEYLESLKNNSSVVWLNQKHIPNSESEIDALDRLYINHFQTAKLTKEQYEALKKWIEAGGDLVLGTGEHASEVLGVFSDDFIKGTIGETTADGRTRLSFEKEEVYKNKNYNFELHRVKKGKGNVWIYNINLGLEKKDWKKLGTEYIEYQLEKQFGDTLFPDTNADGIYTTEALGVRDVKNLPNVGVLVGLFLVYCIASSWGLYLILKKKDCLEKMWLAIPAMAIIFIAIIYIWGSKTRITEPNILYQGVIKFEKEGESKALEKQIMRISAPYNDSYTIVVPEGKKAYPQLGVNDEYLDGYQFDKPYMKFYQGEKNEYIEFEGAEAFKDTTFLTEEKRTMGQGYESNISNNKSQYTGSFTNRTGYTLKSAFLHNGYCAYILGDIKNGETVEINNKTPRYYFSELEKNENCGEVTLDFVSDLFDWSLSKKEKEDCLNNGYYRDCLKLDEYRYVSCITEENFDRFDSPVVYSYVETKKMEKEQKESWGIDCQGIMLCKMPVEISKEEFVENMLKGKKMSEEGVEIESDFSYNYTKSKELTFVYHLEENKELTGMYYLAENNTSIRDDKLLKDKNIIRDMEEWNYYKGKIYAWNYRTKRKDLLFESEKEGSITNVRDYVDERGNLQITLITDRKSDEDEVYENLPYISLSFQKKS